ncbi:hypothetical protein K438DRAFT_1991563 [Mycena galopus ATCC 62051]|nr:hypothetical protein K438DRAFT_1991563 [Mycena galopus ATCC 62051]
MDPFVVISFGKVFRTREIGYEVRLTVLDWDKLTSNDYISAVAFNVSELVVDAPQPLPLPPLQGRSGSTAATSPPLPASGETPGTSDNSADATARERGTRIPLYAEAEGGDHPMKEFKLKLEIGAGGGR